MYSNNIFLLTYNHLNDLIDKCIKEHKDHKYPEGIICDTRYIAEITHKIHKNVLRDIDELMKNLNNQGRRTFREVAKSEPSLILQGENIEVAKFEPHTKILQRNIKDNSQKELAKSGEHTNITQRENKDYGKINLKYEFRVIEVSYYDDRGNMQRAYQISPVAFLVLMGRYNDTITYCLANFFYRVMKEFDISLEKLLKTNIDKLDEASELVSLRDSGDPEKFKIFEQDLVRYRALYGYTKNVAEHMSNTTLVNKSDFCYATSLQIWKITGKTEHNKITRDIKGIIEKLKKDNFDVDRHFVENNARLDNGRTVKIYEMDEIGFLTIMGRYYSWVLYDLSKFYISMKDNIEISADGLLSIKEEVLIDAYETLKDIMIIKQEEKEHIERNLFTDVDYPNMTDEEITEDIRRRKKLNAERISDLKETFYKKYDNKEITI